MANYKIGSAKGIDQVNGMKAGETYTASDGSSWTKNSDGTVSVREKDGSVTNGIRVPSSSGNKGGSGGSGGSQRKTVSIYDENTGNTRSGYIENGNTFLDDGNRISSGMVVKAGDGNYWRKTDSGSVNLGKDYSPIKSAYSKKIGSGIYNGERFVNYDGMNIDMEKDYTKLMQQYKNDPQALKAIEQARNAKIQILMRNGINDYEQTNDYGYANFDPSSVEYDSAYKEYEEQQEALKKRQQEAARAETEAEIAYLENQKKQQQAQYDEYMRQLYVKYMQEKRVLPEQLAVRGLTGGAAEDSLSDLQTAYMQGHGIANANLAASLAGIDSSISSLQGNLSSTLSAIASTYGSAVADAYYQMLQNKAENESEARAKTIARLGL